ncbi:Regulator of RpoS [Streptomyces tendae]
MTTADSQPIRVLVVEDDPVAADAHVMYVGRVPGFVAVGKAHTGAEARRMLDRTPVDLLLLDLHLPDVHGLQLARSLRAAGHHTDVIAVTSARDLTMVREGVSLGVVQYVLKPFTFATLRDRLVRYAEFRATAGEASGQDEVDRALATLRAPGPAALPKGLSGPTLERVTGRAARLGRGPHGGRRGGSGGHLPHHGPALPGAPGRRGPGGPEPAVRPGGTAGVGVPVGTGPASRAALRACSASFDEPARL